MKLKKRPIFLIFFLSFLFFPFLFNLTKIFPKSGKPTEVKIGSPATSKRRGCLDLPHFKALADRSAAWLL